MSIAYNTITNLAYHVWTDYLWSRLYYTHLLPLLHLLAGSAGSAGSAPVLPVRLGYAGTVGQSADDVDPD